MKIASFTDERGQAYGVVRDGGLVTASPAFRGRHPGLRQVLEAGALPALAEDTAGRAPDRDLGSVRLLPPVPDARRVFCVGINYPKRHPVEGVLPPPEHITIFGKMEGTLVGHGEALDIPRGEAAATFDYEGEIVIVIGRGGRHIPRAEALSHVAGYTIMDDGSVRGWQKQSLHAGKNFARSGACGPWMSTADEIPDPSAMILTTRLNGETVQHTPASAMIFPIPQVIEYVSHITELSPGDLISTGSPEGSGGSRQPQRFLVAGDRLEIEVAGIGTLANRIGA